MMITSTVCLSPLNKLSLWPSAPKVEIVAGGKPNVACVHCNEIDLFEKLLFLDGIRDSLRRTENWFEK